MKQAQHILKTHFEETGLRLTLDFGTISLICPTADTIRLRMKLDQSGFVPPLEPGFDRTEDRLLERWKSVKIDPSQFSLPIGEYLLTFSSDPFSFAVLHGENRLLKSLPGRTMFKDSLGRHWHYQVKREEDVYFGLGEKTGRLVRNDRTYRLNNTDAIGYHPEFGDPLYKHIPFYLKYNVDQQHTLGFFLNNAFNSQFDFGSTRSGYWGPFTSICTDGGDLDLFILLGPTPKDVLRQYHQVTGFPALPTKASLGYLGSTMYYTELEKNSDDAVLGFINQCRKHDIPISGFHLSSGYTMGEDGKRYTFTWNQKRFPDPQRFVERMAAAGQVLSPNIKPGMLTTHPLWPEFDLAGAFIRTADGRRSMKANFWGGEASFVDFSNPKACSLWKKHLKQQLIDLGVTSIWNDNNEFEIDNDRAICNDDGQLIPAAALRPILANKMAAVAYEALAEQGNLRPFVLSRAGFSGLQKFAQTWSGDNASTWPDFHFNLATMLGLSLSGMPFNGMDVGGFAGPAPEPELFLRWVQNAAFHPRFSIHSVNSDNTVTEPWLYPSLTPLIRRAIKTRHLFLPTLYSLAAQAHFEGVPPVAPLFYHFPDYEPIRNCHTTFMIGEALLAAAVTEAHASSLDIHFPPGRWRCFYTGQTFSGGQTTQISLTDQYSPLFYRIGHGFFLDANFQNAVDFEGEYRPDSLIVCLNSCTSGRLFFYDDDGRTLDFQNGAVAKGFFQWEVNSRQVALTFERHGSYRCGWQAVYLQIEVEGTCPRAITINDRPIGQTLYREQLTSGRWYYSAAQKAVLIELSGDLLDEDFALTLHFQEMGEISQL
ncbi:MAG: glycoside hydrolase family 31 protein [Ardenticatenaceae bacterium]|nr:glycoside hydrolase family 31 protein [Ardenticatenaceae bacterium]